VEPGQCGFERETDAFYDEEVAWSLRVDEARPLLDAEPEELGGGAALEYLIELQRAQSRLAALEARALVVVTGRHRRERHVTVDDGATGREMDLTIVDEVREEIAAALHRSPGAVHDQLVTARLLAGPLSETRDALADGRISAQHARAIAEQARRLSTSHVACHQPPEADTLDDAVDRRRFTADCATLQARVLPSAARTTPSKTRARARRIVAALDVDAQERRRQQAKALIDVRHYADDDGLAVLFARLPVLDAIRVHAALDARAQAARTECDGTVGQLRAQALVDAICGSNAPAAQVVTEVQIVIDAAALMGSTDTPGSTVVGHDGSQPVCAQVIRELLTDPDVPATLRRLVTDPMTGHLLDRGRSTYRVSDTLRAYLATRDATCRHPGCTRPASGCQVDHAVPWDDGGATTRANTGLLCIRHHQLKTHAGWQILESRDDGSAVWRSPAGRLHEVDPPSVLVRAPTPVEPEPATSKPPPDSADPPF
jgi:hypothetical protein